MPSISETAKKRIANIKATGGIPPAKPKGQSLANDARQIKARGSYEDIPEAKVTRPGRKLR
jgi:hypothetical protein